MLLINSTTQLSVNYRDHYPNTQISQISGCHQPVGMGHATVEPRPIAFLWLRLYSLRSAFKPRAPRQGKKFEKIKAFSNFGCGFYFLVMMARLIDRLVD